MFFLPKMIIEMPKKLRFSMRKHYNLERENEIYTRDFHYQQKFHYQNYNQNFNDRVSIPRQKRF